MAYEILQFNLGKDRAQGYVLRGTGEHEGTNVSLSPEELDYAVYSAEQHLRLYHFDYQPRGESLLLPKEPPDPRLKSALAEYLDNRFLLGHAERTRQEAITPPLPESADSGRR